LKNDSAKKKSRTDESNKGGENEIKVDESIGLI